MSGFTTGFPWEEAIGERARAAGFELPEGATRALAAHARLVLDANDRLHLTSIRDPREFLERHIGESLEGAALIDRSRSGRLLDLGSGNGYPGLPLAILRTSLETILVEASEKKAAFLSTCVERLAVRNARVLQRHVVRGEDVADHAPISVLVSRAMGGWERIVPKLASKLAADARVLIWATDEAEAVFARASWKRFQLVTRRRLSNRDRSFIYQFSPS